VTSSLRLPKSIADDPRAPLLLHALKNANRPLWPGGVLKVREAQLRQDLQDVLRTAHHAGRIARSLEKAEEKLAAEMRGMQMADAKSGIRRGVRISRLLLLTNDGAERFYRQVEALLRRHGQRVVAVRFTCDAEALGTTLYGTGRSARLLMVEHKAAVGAILLRLADQWAHPDVKV